MPIIQTRLHTKLTKGWLSVEGTSRAQTFCNANGIECPQVYLKDLDDWLFESVCAYYRPVGIHICIEKCATVAGPTRSRNWNWPSSTTDREPFGVIAHELGHHVDRLSSERKGSYYGDFSINCRKESGEKPITSYCPNDAEWFAEMFRLFVTNAALLSYVRPRTFSILAAKFKSVSNPDWVKELGPLVPAYIVENLRKKIDG